MEKTTQPVEVLRSYLRIRGLRVTPMREEVLRAAFGIHGHFDAEDLFLRLRKKKNDIRISRATIYRTLPLLVHCGLIREVVFTDKHSHYEHVWGHEHHEHMICLKCGRVIEFSAPPLEKQLDRLARENRFRPTGHKLEITGYCERCLTPGREKDE